MIRVFSFGGGVQSMACLVLASQAIIDYKTFLFCNVGNDSENPATLQYVEQYAIPFAKQHNIEFLTLQRTRHGIPSTILGNITKPGSRSIGIPVYMQTGAPGNRSCTYDYKIYVVDKWLREHGSKEQGAIVGLGISLDEIQRMKPNIDKKTQWKQNVFPLLEEVKRPLTRMDCMNVIQNAGLPIPPKSSCWFCPFHSMRVWQDMREQEPELFRQACELEEFINIRRIELGFDEVYLSRKLKPLEKATTNLVQASLFEEDFCDSGFCFT